VNPEIKVLRISPVTGRGNLRAYADVQFDGITITDCPIVQQNGQAAYVTGPQKFEDGHWWPVVKLTSDLRQHVQAAVLSEWQRQMGGGLHYG
jgi:DNA-binding cell septation regulator SpoVG